MRSIFSLLIALWCFSAVHGQGPGLGNLSYNNNELYNEVSQFTTTNGAPNGHGYVVMHGGYMAIIYSGDAGGGNGRGGFAFYDVSDPRNPVNVFTTQDNSAYTNSNNFNYVGNIGEAHGFQQIGNRIALCTNRPGGMQIWEWDMNNPSTPQKIGEINLPGIEAGGYQTSANDISWSGDIAYVAGLSQGLYIIDTSDPSNPTLVNRGAGKPNPIPVNQLGMAKCGFVNLHGNRLVMTGFQSDGMAVFDITDPINPQAITTTDTYSTYSTYFDGEAIFTQSIRKYDATGTNGIPEIAENTSVPPKGAYLMLQDDIIHMGRSEEGGYVKVDGNSLNVIAQYIPTNYHNPDWDFATALGNLVFLGNDHKSGSSLICHQQAPDNQGPDIFHTFPLDGAVNQSVDSKVGIAFTDQLQVECIDNIQIRPLGSNTPIAGTYSFKKGIVNFWPTQPLASNTSYQIFIPEGSICDYAGNLNPSTFSSVFSTGNSIGNPTTVTLSTTPPPPTILGTPTTFTASATASNGATVEYRWNFGDGTQTTWSTANATVQHSYTLAGNYSVQVTARISNQTSIQTSEIFSHSVQNPVTAVAPTHSSTITYDPNTNRVWAVNSDNRTVTAINANTHNKIMEVVVGEEPTTIAVAPNGHIWVVCKESAEIKILNQNNGSLINTILFPYGSGPHSIVFAPDGSAAYLTLEYRDEIRRLNPTSGTTLQTQMLSSRPRGIAIDASSNRVFVSRFISPDHAGQVWEVAAGNLNITRTFNLAISPGPDTEDNGRGLPNYLRASTISPDGNRLWIPSKKDNIQRGAFRDGQSLTFESTVRPIVSQIDLNTNAEVLNDRLDLNDREMPMAVTFSNSGAYAFVATRGSQAIEIIDAFGNTIAGAIENVGEAPQALLLNPSGNKLFVHNFMSRDVAIYDVSNIVNNNGLATTLLAKVGTVANETLSSQVLRGKQLFYNAVDDRMSQDNYITCASCHDDGGQDGRVWDFTDRGEGFRNTTALNGRAGLSHGRVHWSANFDEIQDFEIDIRNFFGGTGFMSDADYFSGNRAPSLGAPKAGSSADLDAIAAYINSLDSFEDSPYRNSDGSLTVQALAGQLLFDQLGCANCHSGSSFTDSNSGLLHDVGTIKTSSGNRLGNTLLGIDAPTLKDLWKTAPYLHDGSAATLYDVFNNQNTNGAHAATNSLSSTQMDELVIYLQSLDGSSSNINTPSLTLQLSEPMNGEVFIPGSIIPLAINTNISNITKVEYYANGEMIVQSTVTPFSANWTNAVEGNYALQAKVYHGNVERATISTDIQVTLGDPCDLEIDIAIISTTNGLNNGSIDITVTGGTMPYSYDWSNGTNTEDLTGVASAGYNVLVTDANGCTITASIFVGMITDGGGTCVFQESNGVVAIEAENYHEINQRSDMTNWMIVNNGSNAEGYITTPDNGIANGLFGSSAQVIYNFNIQNSGTYHLYVLRRAPNSAGNSVFSSFNDGPRQRSTDNTATNAGEWTWRDIGDITLSAGQHSFEFVRREDGYDIDRFVISTGSIPTGNGPTESSCTGGGNSVQSEYLSVTPSELQFTAAQQALNLNITSNINWTANSTVNWLSFNPTNGQNIGTLTVTALANTEITRTADITVEGQLLSSLISVQQAGNDLACTMNISTTITDVSCKGEASGQISTIVNNGTMPYIFSWSNGATTPNLSNIVAGNYSVTVTDANGCTANATININEPSALNIMMVVTPESVAGAADGTAEVDASGGMPPYTYHWNTGATTANITNLSSGTYEVTVTDANACTNIGIAVIQVGTSPAGQLTVERGITTANDSWQTVSLSKNFDSPVVLTTSVLAAHTDAPVIARVRNVTESSFELKVQNPGDLVATGNRTVHYIVVEEGIYTQAEHGVKMEAVRAPSNLVARSGAYLRENRSYQQTYINPVVVGQVTGASDQWTSFWSSATNNQTSPPSANSFGAGRHVASDPNNTRPDEEISYIVIEQGSGTMAGFEFVAALGEDIVIGPNASPQSYSFTSPLSQNGVAVLSCAAIDGGDGYWPVLAGSNPVGTTQLYLSADEDQITDSERNHTTEQVGYLVLGGDVSLDCSNFSITATSTVESSIGANDGTASATPTGGQSPYIYSWDNGSSTATISGLTTGNYTVTVTDANGCTATATTSVAVSSEGLVVERGIAVVSDSWQTINLSENFTSPIVLTTSVLAIHTDEPVVARVRNVTSSSFELKVQNPGDLVATGNRTVHYVVIEEGVYTIAEHGVKMEAVRTTSSNIAMKGAYIMEPRTYQQNYSKPVIIGQVTGSDTPWTVFWSSASNAQNSPASSTSFAAGRHIAEDSNINRNTEEISYIVIEEGSGTMAGIEFVAAVGDDIVNGPSTSPDIYNFPISLSTNGIAVLSGAAIDGADGFWPVLSGLNSVSNSHLSLFADEDRISDNERNHTTEQVAYLVLASGLTAQKTPIDANNIIRPDNLLIHNSEFAGDEIIPTAAIQVAPNPAIAQILVTLSSSLDSPWKIRLLNLSGQAVLTTIANKGHSKTRIDISQLPPGFYWLVAHNQLNNMILRTPLVIQ